VGELLARGRKFVE